MLTALLSLLLSFVLTHHTLTLTIHPAASTVLIDVEVGNDDYYRSASFYTAGAACHHGHCGVTLRDLPSGRLDLWVSEKDRDGTVTNIDKRSFYIP